MLRRPDTGSHQDGRAAKRAGGQNYLACRKNLCVDKLYADSALAFDDDVVHFGVTADCEVGASADRGGQISDPRIDPHTIDDVERIRANTVLSSTVEIRNMRQPDSFCGFDECTHRRRVLLRRVLADRKRAAAAVPSIIARRGVFHGLVRGKHLLPRPSLDSALGPTREVRWSRAHRDGGVYRPAGADQATPRHQDIVPEAGRPPGAGV